MTPADLRTLATEFTAKAKGLIERDGTLERECVRAPVEYIGRRDGH